MIKVDNHFDEYAYRVATRSLDSSVVSDVLEGQWVMITDAGTIVISDGTRKSFINTSSRRSGRDTITPSGKVTYLHGSFELSTDQYDTGGTYVGMTPLKVKATGGVLMPWVSGTDAANKIEAYAVGAPVAGYLRIVKD